MSCFPPHITLQDGYQSSADARHNVTEQPLFESVDSHPVDDREKRKRCILDPFGITSTRMQKYEEFMINGCVKKWMEGNG